MPQFTTQSPEVLQACRPGHIRGTLVLGQDGFGLLERFTVSAFLQCLGEALIELVSSWKVKIRHDDTLG
jgi:hypothetical protein